MPARPPPSIDMLETDRRLCIERETAASRRRWRWCCPSMWRGVMRRGAWMTWARTTAGLVNRPIYWTKPDD